MNRILNRTSHLLALILALILPLISAALCGQAQTPPLPIKPQPIYEQCQSLTTGTATDDDVAKTIAALKNKDAKVRAQSALQLAKSCDNRAVAPLIDALKDEDVNVRVATIEALGRLGDKDSTESLFWLLDDPDWRIRLALVSSLASFNSFQPRNRVVNGIANPSGADITDPDDMRVRCAAILTVNQLKDVSHSRKSVLFVYGFLKSSHAHIREMAEQTMRELKNTRNGPTELVAILKQNPNPVLRVWAAQWLGKLDIETARKALTEAAAGDADNKVKEVAAEALKGLKNTN